jgi:hypothetical protein
MSVEAGILGGQHRAADMRRDFLERNGVVLADPAPADDLAVAVGEGDRMLAAAVPDVAGAAERRQGEDQQVRWRS